MTRTRPSMDHMIVSATDLLGAQRRQRPSSSPHESSGRTRARNERLMDEARIVLSEPIGDLPGAWVEVPEASYGVIGDGHDHLLRFAVKPPPNRTV
jgi:hypothetical protein